MNNTDHVFFMIKYPFKLFQYYRETEKAESKYEVYEKLTQSEPAMIFGGREWIILRKEGGRCLLLSRYLLTAA